MNLVRQQIAENLFNALYEANSADQVEEYENDLHPHCCHQDDLYGDLSNAIIKLGYEHELNTWVETGDRPLF